MSAKRKASPAPSKDTWKRSRQDSFAPSVEDIDEYSNPKGADSIYFDAQSANKNVAQFDKQVFNVDAYDGGDANDDAVEQAARHDMPPVAGDAMIAANQPFKASIKVNDTIIGSLTEAKIILTSKTFLSYDGRSLPVARPAKRILRLGGSNDGEDGFNVPLAKRESPCALVEISYSAQGCRVTIDGEVTWQRTWSTNAAKESLVAVMLKHAEEDNEEANKYQPPQNEWMQMYIEWRNWAISKLADLQKMQQFPRIPTAVRRCKKPDCSLFAPDGIQRPLRHLRACKHDFEMWFRDAAGGRYNEHYYWICKAEEKRWQPAQFHVWDESKGATKQQVEFRKFAGEIWRNCVELVGVYEQMVRGYVDIPEEFL